MSINEKLKMNFRFILPSIVVIFIILFYERCTLNVVDSEAGNPSVISSNALINLPSSIADAPGIAAEKRFDGIDEAEKIYNFIRLQNYFVNELINNEEFGVRHIIKDFLAKLPWKFIMDNGNYIADSSTFHFEAIYDTNAALPYIVLIQDTLPGYEWIVKAAFNGSSENPKGWVYYFIGTPEDERTDSLEILVSFDKNNIRRLLDVEIDQKLLVDTGDLAQSFKYSLYEENGIIHLSGCSYHPYLDSIIKDTTGYCYTYTAVADTIKNQAVVNLGLPPASYPETTLLFTEYGVANIFGRAFIDYGIMTLEDTVKMIVVTSYKESLTIEKIFKMLADSTLTLHDASEINDMTVEDLKYFLELNSNISDEELKKEYAGLLWILKLTQPVYFNANGYAGNGETVPVGFEALAAIECNRPPFTPSKVKELSIGIPY